MSEYFFIPYVPGAGELTVFCAAMVGASLGFYGLIAIRRLFLWGMLGLWPWAEVWA